MMFDRIVLKDAFSSLDPEDFGEFKPLYPGVEILHLYGGDEDQKALGRPSAALLRYEPGAKVPAHKHRGYEHIFVLSGSQSDHLGEYTAGTCVMSPPGTGHAVTSANGCLVLAIWNEPVEVLEDVES